jgi:hypothetical protein
MGRPKASESVKMIAIQFIKVVTKEKCGPKEAMISVYAHHGRKSLHCALLHCIPQLTRGGHYKENKQVVTKISYLTSFTDLSLFPRHLCSTVSYRLVHCRVSAWSN